MRWSLGNRSRRLRLNELQCQLLSKGIARATTEGLLPMTGDNASLFCLRMLNFRSFSAPAVVGTAGFLLGLGRSSEVCFLFLEDESTSIVFLV